MFRCPGLPGFLDHLINRNNNNVRLVVQIPSRWDRAWKLRILMLSFPLATALSATTFVHGPRVTHPLALAGRARRSTDVVSTIAVFGASGRTGSEVVLQALR